MEENKGALAQGLFEQGYNCAQAVFGAFAEDFGLDFDTAMMISSGFGGGMGRLREVCGCFSAAVMVLSMRYGYSDSAAKKEKAELYAKIQRLSETFKAENGSIICRELLGLAPMEKISPVPEERTKEYYKKRPCAELARQAAELVSEFLKTNG